MSAKGKTGGMSKVGLQDLRNVQVRRPSFVKGFDRANKEMERKLDTFLRKQDEKAVHDARTAIRRLEAHVDLLPREVRRSAEVDDLLKRLKKVMETSAEVRDLDVIKSRVSRRAGDAEAGLLLRIDHDREEAAKDAKRAAESARKLSLPGGISKDVTRGKLSRRYKKVVGRLAEHIEKALPIVASDSRRLDELHKLRIGCKKLRYTLEAVEVDADAVAGLRKWQDALGSIHDWDVTVSYVRKAGASAAGELLRTATREREREFESFSRSVLGPGHSDVRPRH